ncbi:EAL domain-containing protein [Rhizobium halophilum]|uniref:EAL domain-containing protein n=1 Tax=Rhizobium halophilum TaxID=2846852 RepID=UPI001EFE1764|nr:EAL domain-containing protein [Rhizobium halophilum]MCF6371145.1 EAL domain-containing protein [Rhizobium halophilum]
MARLWHVDGMLGFESLNSQREEESMNTSMLHDIAIDKQLVSLAYQPIQWIPSGAVDTVEALLRLRMLDGRHMAPELFIAAAERSGQILELGLWAIRTVCLQLLTTDRVSVASVNVSPVQLNTPGFAASVEAILVETGVSGARLAFEITEGQKLEVQPVALQCIAELRRLGVAIWLDDFGTGYAGLSLLRQINFDVVKIDRSFLHASASQQGFVMLRNIVKLVNDHGPEVLLEGIECSEHLKLAKKLDVRMGQGFYIGVPSVPDFADRLHVGTIDSQDEYWTPQAKLS